MRTTERVEDQPVSNDSPQSNVGELTLERGLAVMADLGRDLLERQPCRRSREAARTGELLVMGLYALK